LQLPTIVSPGLCLLFYTVARCYQRLALPRRTWLSKLGPVSLNLSTKFSSIQSSTQDQSQIVITIICPCVSHRITQWIARSLHQTPPYPKPYHVRSPNSPSLPIQNNSHSSHMRNSLHNLCSCRRQCISHNSHNWCSLRSSSS
jgi:hypothetical protein